MANTKRQFTPQPVQHPLFDMGFVLRWWRATRSGFTTTFIVLVVLPIFLWVAYDIRVDLLIFQIMEFRANLNFVVLGAVVLLILGFITGYEQSQLLSHVSAVRWVVMTSVGVLLGAYVSLELLTRFQVATQVAGLPVNLPTPFVYWFATAVTCLSVTVGVTGVLQGLFGIQYGMQDNDLLVWVGAHLLMLGTYIILMLLALVAPALLTLLPLALLAILPILYAVLIGAAANRFE